MVGKVIETHFPTNDRGGENPKDEEVFITSAQRQPAGMIGAFTDNRRTTVIINPSQIAASETSGLRPVEKTRFLFPQGQPISHLRVVLEEVGSRVTWSTRERNGTTQVTVSHGPFPYTQQPKRL